MHEDVLGKKARDCMPYIMQGFIEKPSDTAKGLEFDRVYGVLYGFRQKPAENSGRIYYGNQSAS